MSASRVKIVYRPLRIAWAIRKGDVDALRKSINYSHLLWGGVYNPIIVVEDEENANAIIQAFRADIVYQISAGDVVTKFIKEYSHLISPFWGDIFIDGARPYSNVLDIENSIYSLINEINPEEISGLSLIHWEESDPLSDFLLMQYGSIPPKSLSFKNYENIIISNLRCTRVDIGLDTPLSETMLTNQCIADLSNYRINRHFMSEFTTLYHGFYFGDIGNFDNLVEYWNLKASSKELIFIDKKYISRFSQIIPAWKKKIHEYFDRAGNTMPKNVYIWHNNQKQEEMYSIFPQDSHYFINTNEVSYKNKRYCTA